MKEVLSFETPVLEELRKELTIVDQLRKQNKSLLDEVATLKKLVTFLVDDNIDTRLHDKADGVKGHVCVGIFQGGSNSFWCENKNDWSSAGTVIHIDLEKGM